MTNTNGESYILLAKSYQRPVSRREWDSVDENPRSGVVLNCFGLKNWHEFMRDICHYNVPSFTKMDVIRLGKTLGTAIDSISLERWDEIVSEFSVKSDQMIPTSGEIMFLFGKWYNFKSIVKKKPKTEQDKKLEKIEKLFFSGIKPINIARKTKIREKKIIGYLESVGLFTPEYISKEFPNLTSITKKQILNSKIYDGEEKQIVRDLMNESLLELGDEERPLKYCGLPGVNFIDYIQFCQEHDFDTFNSLVAEEDKILANAMESIKRSWERIDGGRFFRKLPIFRGRLEKALESKKYLGRKFNCFNLDWVGGWGIGKQKTLVNMFKYDHVSDKTLVFITLNDSNRERALSTVAARGYEFKRGCGEEHIEIAAKSLENLAEKNRFSTSKLLTIDYRDTTDMVSGFFYLEKR